MQVRIGIDVGGTFTHAVAIAADRYELIAQAKVPTTHTAQEGVARGIIQSLREILSTAGLKPSDVTYIAHSTTQATNALLEGDVCAVGILAIGSGMEGKMARTETNIEPVELAPGLFVTTYHHYLETAPDAQLSDEVIDAALEQLTGQGAVAIVAATAFSVDKPELELKVLECAARRNIPATATHEISLLYGLKARTRTAVVNAAILPKMIDTAEKTNESVRSMGITAPLVVMRSDGGAMGIEEMKKRPIMTLLSGPAAGVAAALMAARIADGIFLEVGGTSTDISCIVNGHPSVKMARIGNHNLYLNTIDVRTLGIAGGSLAKIKDKAIAGVGPRSAHIAGLKYAAFTKAENLTAGSTPQLINLPKDKAQYLALAGSDNELFTVTATCAANQLDLIPDGDYASGDKAAVSKACSAFASFLGLGSADELAKLIMQQGSEQIIATVKELVTENKLELPRVTLVGGGGGASVWLHFVSKCMGLSSLVVDNAPVISAIGAAMALLQETVERTIIDPQPQDFTDIRAKAENALIKTGADPQTIEVRVEVDSKRGILRATATGAHQLVVAEDSLPEEELHQRAANILNAQPAELTASAKTSGFLVYSGQVIRKRFWGLLSSKRSPWAVIDHRGRTRLSAGHGVVNALKGRELIATLRSLIETHTIYGDAGAILPAVFLVTDNKIVDLSGLTTLEQMVSICQEEQRRLSEESMVVIAVKLG